MARMGDCGTRSRVSCARKAVAATVNWLAVELNEEEVLVWLELTRWNTQRVIISGSRRIRGKSRTVRIEEVIALHLNWVAKVIAATKNDMVSRLGMVVRLKVRVIGSC